MIAVMQDARGYHIAVIIISCTISVSLAFTVCFLCWVDMKSRRR